MLVCVQHYVEFKLDFGLLTKEVHLTIPITFISPAQHAVAESMLNPSKDSNASSSSAAGASPAKTSSDAKPYQSPATPRRMKSVQNLAAALGGGELLIDLSDGPATSSAPAVTTAATSTIPSSSTSSSSSFSPMLQQAKAHSISPVVQAQPYMQQAQPLPQPMFTRSGSSSTLIRGFSSHHGLVYVPSPQHGQPQPQPQPIWDPFASPVPATQPIQPQQPQQPQQLQQQQQPMMMVRRQPSVGGGLIPSPSPPMATQPAPQGMAPLLRSPSTNWAQW